NPTGLTWKGGASASPAAVERAYRRVARYADGWMTNKLSPSEFRAELGRVRAIAGGDGRDPAALGSALYHNININDDRAKALEVARTSYEALGFTVVPGGRHPVGTHNALVAFGDGSYVELIAFYEKNPAHKWWTPLQKGGGLVDFCMQTDDLRGDTAAFRKAGVEIDDP